MGQRAAARVLGIVGRVLVGSGVIILLFAAYQLWGTGIAESRSQNQLEDEFSGRIAALGPDSAAVLRATTTPTTTTTAPGSSTTPSTAATTTTLPPELIDLLFPSTGEPVGRIVIPKIGVDKVVVEGTETDDLRKGPGHFADTPLPGQEGNAAIAGHRTTYGAPFGDIDQLEPGDEIRVTTVLGDAVYKVAGTQIVQPEQVEVVGDFGDNRLTLTACHPKFSAAQRIVVWGLLEGEATPVLPRPEDRRTIELAPSTSATVPTSAVAPPLTTVPSTTTIAPTTTVPATTSTVVDSENHLGGDRSALPGAIGWALGALAVGVLGWVAAWQIDVRRGQRALRRWGIYALTSPLFGVCLFFCFAHVDRLLPAY